MWYIWYICMVDRCAWNLRLLDYTYIFFIIAIPHTHLYALKRITLPACRYLNCIIDAHIFYDCFVADNRILQWHCRFQIQILYKFMKHLYANSCVCLLLIVCHLHANIIWKFFPLKLHTSAIDICFKVGH